MGSAAPMDGKCGGKLRDGTFCARWPLKGRKRCRKHGGLTPIGPTSPAYKHGRYSKAPLLAEADRRVAEQADLLDLRPGIALFDVRIEEMAARLEDEDTPGLRVKAIALIDEGKVDQARDLLVKGATRDAAWERLLETQERRSERAERAQDRWLKHAQVYHLEELRAAVATMVDILAQHVPRETVAQVVQDFDARLLAPAGS